MAIYTPSDSSIDGAPSRSRSLRRTFTDKNAEHMVLAHDALARIQAMDGDTMERHRREGNAFYAREQLATMAAGHREGEPSPSTPMTTMTQFIPPELVAAARPRSTSPQKNFQPLKLVPEGKEDAHPTHRQSIEAKHEKRLFQVMDIEPATPPATSSDESPSETSLPTKTKIVYIERDKESGPKSPKKKFLGLPISIPTYKSRTTVVSDPRPSTPEGSTPPPKAVQFFGGTNASSRSKKSLLPNASRSHGATSNSSKSLQQHALDSTLINQFNPTLDGKQPKGRVASEGSRTTAEKPCHGILKATNQQGDLLRSQSLRYFERNGSPSPPPTPPAKNTPPPKDKVTTKTAEKQGLGISAVIRDVAKDSTDVLMMHDEGSTPIKLSFGPKDNVSFLQKVPSVYSMHASIENASFSAGYNQVSDPHPAAQQGHSSESQLQKPFDRVSNLPPPLLKPAFYTPSIYSTASDFPCFRPSMNLDRTIYSLPLPREPETAVSHDRQASEEVMVMFRGEKEELSLSPDKTTPKLSSLQDSKDTQGSLSQRQDSASNATQDSSIQLQPKTQAEQHENPSKAPKRASDTPVKELKTPKPKALNENNSLREALATGITPLLLGESPDLNRNSPSPFIPHYPSACPTPLKLAAPTLVPPSMPSPSEPSPRLSMISDGSDMFEGFSSISNHLASVQSRIESSMQTFHKELLQTMLANHEQAVATLNRSFTSVRSHLDAIDQTTTRTANSVAAAELKLTDLMNLVQSQLVAKLEQLLHLNHDLSVKVDTLGERVRELENGHLLLRQQLKAHGTLVTDPQLVAWGGHEVKLRPGVLRGMGSEGGRKVCEAYGRRVEGDGTEKHPCFNGGSGRGGAGEGVGGTEPKLKLESSDGGKRDE